MSATGVPQICDASCGWFLLRHFRLGEPFRRQSETARQKHYQANPEAPIFEELRGIAVKTFGVGDVVRGALLPLAKKIRTAFIYGSVFSSSRIRSATRT